MTTYDRPGSIPGAVAVKLRRARLAFVLLVVASVGTVAPAAWSSSTVHAVDCTTVVPLEAVEGGAYSTGKTGALTPESSLDNTLALADVLPGGSIVGRYSGEASALLDSGAEIAAALVLGAAGSGAACGVDFFLDALLGDGDQISESLTSTSSVTYGDPQDCSAFNAYYDRSARGGPAGGGNELETISAVVDPFGVRVPVCRTIGLPSTITGTSLGWYVNEVATTRADVTIGPLAPGSSYSGYLDIGCISASASPDYGISGGCNGTGFPSVYLPSTDFIGICGNTPGTYCSGSTVPHASMPLLIRYGCGQATVSHSVAPSWGNVGGVCGVPPGRYFGLASTSGTAFNWRVFVEAWPEVNETGWQRQWYTDVECRAASGTSTSWIRATSSTFWDTLPNVRVPIPKCSTGQIPNDIRVSKVPTGVPCAAASSGGCASRWHVYVYTPPAALESSATQPDWATCLGVGAACSPPTSGPGGTCTWGGASIDPDACLSTKQVEGTDLQVVEQPVPVGELAPTPGDVLDTANPRLADPVDPPDEPPTGTIIEVPIDDGGEDTPRGVAIISGDDEGECFPDGWGWFNPVSWVYRPVKCALEWAFVPPDGVIDDQVDELQTELEAQLPFSLMYMLVDFAVELNDAMEESSDSGCFDTGGSWSFGTYGSVPIDDVCIGGAAEGPAGTGLHLSTQHRQLLTTLLITMMWFAVIRHAVGTIRGVFAGTGGDMETETVSERYG